jgi:hypothetical protein
MGHVPPKGDVIFDFLFLGGNPHKRELKPSVVAAECCNGMYRIKGVDRNAMCLLVEEPAFRCGNFEDLLSDHGVQ